MLEKIEGKEYLEASDDFDAFNNRFGECRVDGYRDLIVLLQD